MSENKDQNRDESTPGGSSDDAEGSSDLDEAVETNPEQDLTDIDSILTEEDPDFLSHLTEIHIPPGTALTDLDAPPAAVENRTTATEQIKKLFNIKEKPKVVGSFWLLVFVVAGALFFIWNSKNNPFSESLFLNSYSGWNSLVKDYNPNTESELFYENPRFSKNLMTLSKMFINVKSSESSGPTPMLALEVNVEGISSDAIIEIKDREAEFKDLLIRFVEERTYDELITTEGKINLCDQFRIIINSHLTLGQVRKVLLKSFIIKP